MSPIDILFDVVLVGSTVAVRFVPVRRARYTVIAVMIASYFAVAWMAAASPTQQEVVAIYLAAVFVTEATRLFQSKLLSVGLSLMFVSTDLRLFLLHEMPVISGVVMAALFAVIQIAAAAPAIERFVVCKLHVNTQRK